LWWFVQKNIFHDMRRWTVFFFKDSTCEKITKELEIFLYHAHTGIYLIFVFFKKKNYLLYQNHITEASSTTTCFSHLFLRKLCEGFWLLFLLVRWFLRWSLMRIVLWGYCLQGRNCVHGTKFSLLFGAIKVHFILIYSFVTCLCFLCIFHVNYWLRTKLWNLFKF
jgi:hypothetical protein